MKNETNGQVSTRKSFYVIKEERIKLALSAITKENILATIGWLGAMGTELKGDRFTITDGRYVLGARQVIRTIVEHYRVDLRDCNLKSQTVLIDLMKQIGVELTDLGELKREKPAQVSATKAIADQVKVDEKPARKSTSSDLEKQIIQAIAAGFAAVTKQA